jgi:alpha-mannosidase
VVTGDVDFSVGAGDGVGGGCARDSAQTRRTVMSMKAPSTDTIAAISSASHQ